VLVRASRWPAALPQYTLGHSGRVSHIRERLAAHRGLFVAGAAYTGVGIPDCIASGEAAADEALAHLHAADREAPSASA
jgi:oxygen-dependent protoporphyrinogen oxidase